MRIRLSDDLPALADRLRRRERLSDIRNDASVGQLDHAVAVLLGEIAVVRNDDDQLCFRQLFQRVEHLLAGFRVQRAGRLVGHNDLGILD